MSQNTLPFLPRKLTHAEKAEKWMASHPQAMAMFARFAEQLRAAGRRFGVKLLAERIRWEMHFAGSKTEEYKICNSYTAYIARRLIEDDPRLAELIELRPAGS